MKVPVPRWEKWRVRERRTLHVPWDRHTVSSGGEKVTEEGDRREMNLHEVFSLRVTKLKGSVKHSGTDGLY